MTTPNHTLTAQEFPSIYNRRQPEQTPLYQAVLSGLEEWLCAHWEDPFPQHVELEFRKYLRCGILAFGFARAHCEDCGHDFLIAFSCKCRGVCPSCGTRRMAEIAAHLVDHLIPHHPLRQWVLTLPKRLRWHIHRDAKLCSKVLKIFMDEVQKKLRATSAAGSDSQFGAVTFLQRFGSTLNIHPHFHSCVMDGMFVPDGDIVRFQEAQIDHSDICEVRTNVRRRVLKLFARQGILTNDEAVDMLHWNNGGGFSLDGSVRIEANDRTGLERLIRYCARPPFSGERLRLEESGNLLYMPKKPGPHGRGLMSMTAPELLEKLSQLIPPPRSHRHHYHGAFAPGARLRPKVVILAMLHPKIIRSDCPIEEKPRATYQWARLIARIYETEPLVCPRCSGSMRIVAFIEERDVIVAILSHMGESVEPPVPSPARGPPEWDEEFYDPFPEDSNRLITEFPDEIVDELQE